MSIKESIKNLLGLKENDYSPRRHQPRRHQPRRHQPRRRPERSNALTRKM